MRLEQLHGGSIREMARSQRRLHRRPSRFTRFCGGTSAKLIAGSTFPAASRSMMSGTWGPGGKELVAFGRKPAGHDQSAFQGILVVTCDAGGTGSVDWQVKPYGVGADGEAYGRQPVVGFHRTGGDVCGGADVQRRAIGLGLGSGCELIDGGVDPLRGRSRCRRPRRCRRAAPPSVGMWRTQP